MSAEGVQAVLMAGGRGTRLHPYTSILPKPLLPVGDKPVLELLLQHLHRHGVRSVVIAVNHLHHLIRNFFGDGSTLGMRIDYVVEDVPLGTCGPVGGVLDRMAEDFLVMNGDLLTDIDLTQFMRLHRDSSCAATVAGTMHTQQLDYGVLDVDATGRLRGYREKPQTEWLVSTGIYALRRDAVREFVPAGSRLDMPELLERLIAAELPVHVWRGTCRWQDIGRPEEYAAAQSWSESGSPM
jgi:NDP-sugar pyrophosphorylase family protein